MYRVNETEIKENQSVQYEIVEVSLGGSLGASKREFGHICMCKQWCKLKSEQWCEYVISGDECRCG